ncbi:YhhA family cyclophane-containing RiPP [Sphingobium tyrosinilyticum]|uniref:YhhA family cyclophane-containing RiPP n=1 Tax=Sphingobium tyrosinilyticum TaxID=2715436 RepID=A0ABV9F175_9SPHN
MQVSTPKANQPANLLGRIADSVTLARLIEEVRNEDLNVARSYDRTHNRHNR